MSEVLAEMVMDSKLVDIRSDGQNRRKRNRQRRKRKFLRQPYSILNRSRSVRAQDVRQEMFTNGQPVAPYNTTQFLIEDHGDLQNIDVELSKAPDHQHRHSRTRDSSFSIDSDDAFFYSSPEDEEEFLTREFSLEYQDLHVERLNSLPKADIIRDYLVLESKYEKSMGELRKLKTDSGRDTDGSSKSDGSTKEQLKMAQQENRRLKAELEKVKRENERLAGLDKDSSVDSETDSSSSDSSMDSSDSESPPDSPHSFVLEKEEKEIGFGAACSESVPAAEPGNKVNDEEMAIIVNQEDQKISEVLEPPAPQAMESVASELEPQTTTASQLLDSAATEELKLATPADFEPVAPKVSVPADSESLENEKKVAEETEVSGAATDSSVMEGQ